MTTAIIAIGRNEGTRFQACLASITNQNATVIYVDSGSTDDSVAHAKAAGVEVVHLDMDQPFTAARARNAGVDRLVKMGVTVDFIQFIDGDCVLDPDWLKTAETFLNTHPDVAAVCGRLRERFPNASLYNRLIDAEWDRPAGQTDASGGIVMMRAKAFSQVDGFNEAMIAGEEPELCYRLRQQGWDIWIIAAEMALHDVDMHHFGQWWKRSMRAGYTYAEGAALHGKGPEQYNRRELQRAILWGGVFPIIILIAAVLISIKALLAVLIWPAQILRLTLRGEHLLQATFLTIGKFPEAQGALKFWRDRRAGRKARLIEYK
ncbi:glycosyltransferase family 2 protein [Algirhabdus cladophorae]|uniref:glycosyltransferase family 2 protein n=1 Tax=Algirhabdus cladophorae TaxID=3377108 RepID=UPI003B84ABE7